MSWIRRIAVLAAVATGSVLIVSCADQQPTPATQFEPLREPEQFAESYPDVYEPVVTPDVLATLDDVRKSELSRRATRPAGDPERKYAFNYTGVLKGFEQDGNRPNPKPADVMPATACSSVEPIPDQADRISGPGWVHLLTLNQFENQSGFGFTRMLVYENKRGIAYSSKAIDRVELVSLLTALQPSVYVLDEMATPPLARQAKRRELDEFERRGLDAVRKGEQLVWTREAPKRMFGAIRASKNCLDCHMKAKEGDLLGAFTYYLEVPADQVER